jgi:hypothetical protein
MKEDLQRKMDAKEDFQGNFLKDEPSHVNLHTVSNMEFSFNPPMTYIESAITAAPE